MKYKEVQELKDQEEQAEDNQVELWIGDQDLVDQAEARDKGESVEEEEEVEENMEEKSIQMELHLKVN